MRKPKLRMPDWYIDPEILIVSVMIVMIVLLCGLMGWSVYVDETTTSAEERERASQEAAKIVVRDERLREECLENDGRVVVMSGTAQCLVDGVIVKKWEAS